MKLRVLGVSGSEIPGRNLPAFLVDGTILLDAGTVGQSLDTRAQLRITHILLTHAHLDHIKGIPFLLDNMLVAHTGSSLTLLSGRDVLADIKKNLLNNRIWPDFTKIPDSHNPSLKYRTVHPVRQFSINGYHIYCERMDHTVPAYGYIIRKRGEKSLAYTGDTGPTTLFWQKVSRLMVDCLIVETSFPDSLTDLALKSGHLTPALLKNVISMMDHIPPKIYITHAKPEYLKEIRKELKAFRMSNLEFLQDNQILTL